MRIVEVSIGQPATFVSTSTISSVKVFNLDLLTETVPDSVSLGQSPSLKYASIIMWNTGDYAVRSDSDELLGYLKVSAKTMADRVRDIEDESLGTWVLTKSTQQLVLYRRDGTVLQTYSVTENSDIQSKELGE